MKTNSVKKLIQVYKRELAFHYPDHEIMNMIYLLFEEYLGWTKTRIHLSYDSEIPEKELRSFNHALTQLCTGKPIQYILGWALFDGNKLKVNSNVLVPRRETEELCLIIKSDLHLKSSLYFSILDIGTGSGCISIDLKKHFPNARVTGIDSSQAAIEMAIINARDNGCDIDFLQSDILNPTDLLRLGSFDVIVSNPPYVLESEKKFMHQNVIGFEPFNALFVPDVDPLIYYRVIAAFAHDHLMHPGCLFFEINEQYGVEVCQLVQSLGFEKVEILCDINGKDRFVRAIVKVNL